MKKKASKIRSWYEIVKSSLPIRDHKFYRLNKTKGFSLRYLFACLCFPSIIPQLICIILYIIHLDEKSPIFFYVSSPI
ncbi:hypothetical protein [Cytobacillus firmus]|uniref:hypothetical protein n=1 Tax=Cytobacillus firmus TaxID=1399 RepID=UPI0018CD7E5F|nr:hypothetical protein [Cytobacillus firmus]MBG9586348.1 hypothetical protein [Cytobacillus firmus]